VRPQEGIAVYSEGAFNYGFNLAGVNFLRPPIITTDESRNVIFAHVLSQGQTDFSLAQWFRLSQGLNSGALIECRSHFAKIYLLLKVHVLHTTALMAVTRPSPDSEHSSMANCPTNQQ
jgi:hypothetical protein